jgi:hypothetical protein
MKNSSKATHKSPKKCQKSALNLSDKWFSALKRPLNEAVATFNK